MHHWHLKNTYNHIHKGWHWTWGAAAKKHNINVGKQKLIIINNFFKIRNTIKYPHYWNIKNTNAVSHILCPCLIPARFVVSFGNGPWGGAGWYGVSKVPDELHRVWYISHSQEGYICICGISLLCCIDPHCWYKTWYNMVCMLPICHRYVKAPS